MKVWLCNLAFQNQNCQKYHNNKYKQAKWKSNNEANVFTKEAFILPNVKANHQQDPNPLSKTPNNVLKDQTVIVNL